MELNVKETEIINNIRQLQKKCPNQKIIVNLQYEPLTEGWLQTIRVANPLPITAIRSEMYQMLNKIKKELGNNQALFTIFYDAGILHFFRAIGVDNYLNENVNRFDADDDPVVS